MRMEVRFAGFGGQGVISAAKISGRAAAINDNLNAVLTQSYGPEARGGACSANVVISQEKIAYPEVTLPNLLVILSQEAYTTFGSTIALGGTLIIDQDLVSEGKISAGIHLYKVPATKLAEELGNRVVANVVILGAVVAITDMVSKGAMLKSVRASVPARFLELNERAFETGYNYGRKLKS
ncbi:MAG: 2-oxoacid:acceptor oxidoreductase family protein [Candidatus Bipolaricaulota bacterium]|nr:2-oxoacid:acceptor oxidoreductase family protein [Candidatus Bipolaricaulota bacterium]